MLEEAAKIIYLLAMGQGFLIIYALALHKSANPLSNKLLLTFIIAMLLPLWEGYVMLAGPALTDYSIPYLFWFLPWSYGPLLYFYTRSVCQKNFSLRPTHGLHLLVFAYPLLIITFTEQLTLWIDYLIVRRISWALFFVHLFSCIYVCFRLISQYQRPLNRVLSESESMNLVWLKTILIGFSAVYLLDVSTYYIMAFTGTYSHWYFHSFVLAESIYIFVLGFTALRNPMIYPNTIERPDAVKYKKSALTPHLADQLVARVNQLVIKEELFTRSDLTLSNLADRIAINPHLLSQVINSHMGLSFYELINQGRIDKAKDLLQSNDNNLTVLDIAYKVGFNNKTSFNNAFKKFVRMTPTEYKKQVIT